MNAEVSTVIDRPPAIVFRFVAAEHVRNHPRWDPKMQLQQESPGAIGVGTVIRRRHTHTGSPVEGTMTVVEYELDRAFAMVIREGPIEMRSRLTFDPEGEHGTRLTGTIDMPAMTERIDTGPIERSLRKMKELIEAER